MLVTYGRASVMYILFRCCYVILCGVEALCSQLHILRVREGVIDIALSGRLFSLYNSLSI